MTAKHHNEAGSTVGRAVRAVHLPRRLHRRLPPGFDVHRHRSWGGDRRRRVGRWPPPRVSLPSGFRRVMRNDVRDRREQLRAFPRVRSGTRSAYRARPSIPSRQENTTRLCRSRSPSRATSPPPSRRFFMSTESATPKRPEERPRQRHRSRQCGRRSTVVIIIANATGPRQLRQGRTRRRRVRAPRDGFPAVAGLARRCSGTRCERHRRRTRTPHVPRGERGRRASR